jgi:hypothetical protein
MLLTEGAAPQGIVIHQSGWPAPPPPPAQPAKINYITEGAHEEKSNRGPIAQSSSVRYHSETSQAPRTQPPPNQALTRHDPATRAPPRPANQLQITGSSATPESNEEKKLRLKIEVERKKIRKGSMEDEIKAADARAADQKRMKEKEKSKREAKIREQKARREENEKEVREQIRINEVEAACEEDIQKEKEATDKQRRKNKEEARTRKDKQKGEAGNWDGKEKQLEEEEEVEESVLKLERERDDRKRELERKKEQRKKESDEKRRREEREDRDTAKPYQKRIEGHRHSPSQSPSRNKHAGQLRIADRAYNDPSPSPSPTRSYPLGSEFNDNPSLPRSKEPLDFSPWHTIPIKPRRRTTIRENAPNYAS